MNDPEDEGIVTDRLLGGRLTLQQPRRGHRAGTDAVLLAAAAGADPDDRFVDVGAGVGTVGLAIALQTPLCRGILLESDLATARLARRNVLDNGLDSRVTVATFDLFDRAACIAHGLGAAASLVVTNPPFFLAGRVRASPDAKKAEAHVLKLGDGRTHGLWLQHAVKLLRPQGRLVLIHRPEALSDLCTAAEGRLGSLVVRAVHAKADEPAIRILLGGRLGGRGPLTLLPPLVLHETDGRFTGEAEALHRAEPMVFWAKSNRPRRPVLFAGSRDQ